MQEAVVHVTAVVEYVIHCAYTARRYEGTATSALMDQLDGIRHKTTDTGIEFLEIEHSDVRQGQIYDCLQTSVDTANKAILKGTGVTGRRHGRKAIDGEDKHLIPLWVLTRLLPEVMDVVIFELCLTVRQVIGAQFDEIESSFEIRMTDLLRIFDELYQKTGSCYGEAINAVPNERASRKLRDLVSEELYRYTPFRLR